MQLLPEDIIASFLEQARKHKIAAVLFTTFARDEKVVQRMNHNINTGTEKAFMDQFLAVDADTIEAAARAVFRFSVPEAAWDLLPEEHKTLFRKAAETIILAARTAQVTAPLKTALSSPPVVS